MTRLYYSTLREAGEAVGLSADRLRAAIAEGSLRAKRTGRSRDGEPAGRYLISADDLRAWVDGLPDA